MKWAEFGEGRQQEQNCFVNFGTPKPLPPLVRCVLSVGQCACSIVFVFEDDDADALFDPKSGHEYNGSWRRSTPPTYDDAP
jgi:hypothetical protein